MLFEKIFPEKKEICRIREKSFWNEKKIEKIWDGRNIWDRKKNLEKKNQKNIPPNFYNQRQERHDVIKPTFPTELDQAVNISG